MNINKKNVSFLFAAAAFTVFAVSGINAVYTAPVQPLEKPSVRESVCDYVVAPSQVVAHPNKYLNKNISFNAEFVSFTSLGLDYQPALRESSKYIGILIKRDDVKDHTIPLSEMKLFITREVAEKHVDLEQGDKVKITGTVFSNALGDPWVDVKSLDVTEKINKEKESEK